MTDRLAEQLSKVGGALAARRIPFVLVGRLARAAHGDVARAAYRIDLLIDEACQATVNEFVVADERLRLSYVPSVDVRKALADAIRVDGLFACIPIASSDALTKFRDPDRYVAAPSADPFEQLDELMEVVEALCHAAPKPPLRPLGTDYRL